MSGSVLPTILIPSHVLRHMNKSIENAVEFNINMDMWCNVQCAMCFYFGRMFCMTDAQHEAAEKYMKSAAHGVCAIFVVHRQLLLLLLRQQKPKLKMFFYCCCWCFSTSFFAIQFINMENGFGNWSVKCALLIRRIGRSRPSQWGLT